MSLAAQQLMVDGGTPGNGVALAHGVHLKDENAETACSDVVLPLVTRI